MKTFKRNRVGLTDLFRIINPLQWPWMNWQWKPEKILLFRVTAKVLFIMIIPQEEFQGPISFHPWTSASVTDEGKYAPMHGHVHRPTYRSNSVPPQHVIHCKLEASFKLNSEFNSNPIIPKCVNVWLKKTINLKALRVKTHENNNWHLFPSNIWFEYLNSKYSFLFYNIRNSRPCQT